MTAFERCVSWLIQEVKTRLGPRVTLSVAAALSVLVPAAMLGPGTAWGHGAAQWIAEGGYKSPNGATCCGVNDCHRAEGAKATRVLNGYKVAVQIDGDAYNLFVPTSAVFGSIDDAVWFCALPQDYLNGQARCLFLPGSV
jgi:hypothetical protein